MYNPYNSRLDVYGFFEDGVKVSFPSGTVERYVSPDNLWGLYVNESTGESWIRTRASYKGILGWRIRQWNTVLSVSYADNFVNTACKPCIDSYKV
jgi:hypothetical protein